jgi:hypothetical protein
MLRASPYVRGTMRDDHEPYAGATPARIVDVPAKAPRCADMGFLDKERRFWAEAPAVAGSALPVVLPRATLFGLFAPAVTAVDLEADLPDLNIEITSFEVAGGVLSLLLVLRTNAGYERWWAGRWLRGRRSAGAGSVRSRPARIPRPSECAGPSGSTPRSSGPTPGGRSARCSTSAAPSRQPANPFG